MATTQGDHGQDRMATISSSYSRTRPAAMLGSPDPVLDVPARGDLVLLRAGITLLRLDLAPKRARSRRRSGATDIPCH